MLLPPLDSAHAAVLLCCCVVVFPLFFLRRLVFQPADKHFLDTAGYNADIYIYINIFCKQSVDERASLNI